jgi:ribonuclease-3
MAKLLEALDDVLAYSSANRRQSQDRVDEMVGKCRELRWMLVEQEHLIPQHSTTNGHGATQPASIKHVPNEIPSKIPPPSSLTPWTSSSIPTTLPPLPPINPTLEIETFTHRAATTHARPLSYERLEWLGDAYIEIISTLLISSTFKQHQPGKCAQIREYLVKNETLASFAEKYKFEERASLPLEYLDGIGHGHKAKQTERVKVLGDIFEAYVAAVILSDPQHGVDTAASWLKALWAQNLEQQIKDQEKMNDRINQRGNAKPNSDKQINSKVNAKDLLRIKIGAKGVELKYKEAAPETKDKMTGFPLYAMGVYLDGWGEQNKLLGVGRALRKKEAEMKACEVALENKELIGLYEERKRQYQEKERAGSGVAASTQNGV